MSRIFCGPWSKIATTNRVPSRTRPLISARSMELIRTERLVLRQLDFDDAPFILELLNEAEFLRYIGDKGVRTLADSRQYIAYGPMDSYCRYGYGLYAAC